MRSVLAGILFFSALGLPVPASSLMLECYTDADTTMVLPAPNSWALVLPAPDSRAPEARGIWLSESLLRWPGVEASGRFRLHYSADGTAVAEPGARVTGVDGSLDLEPVKGPVPPEIAERFRHVAAGITLRTAASKATLRELHRKQLLLAQGDAGRDVAKPF